MRLVGTDSIEIRLFGTFAVRIVDGDDVTPTSRKAKALLAMLAECDTMKRSRRWLEDKLWSDRGARQAQGSLRTTLHEIRQSLGTAGWIFEADRECVWLHREAVRTDLGPACQDREFLEGLDIGDAEFNDWLIQKRVAYSDQDDGPSEPKFTDRRVAIQCGTPWIAGSSKSAYAQMLDDQVAKIISDFIALSHCTTDARKSDLIVRTSVDETAQGSLVFAQVVDTASDEIVHSDHFFTDGLSRLVGNQETVGRFCWGFADTALERLHDLGDRATPAALRSGFLQRAMNDVLSFRAGRMENSLSVLDDATSHLRAGLFFAAKAWALMSIMIEGHRAEDADGIGEVRALLRLAEESSRGEAMVAGLSANVMAVLLQDYETAATLARRALRENPNNLFALQALAVCRTARGDFEAAYRLSCHSQTVAALTRFEGMCNLHHALMCIKLNRLGEAASAAARSSELLSSYRAPKRQLIALGALEDSPQDIHEAVESLRRIEPGFELDRYLFDRSYPTDTARDAGLLDAVKSRMGLPGKG